MCMSVIIPIEKISKPFNRFNPLTRPLKTIRWRNFVCAMQTARAGFRTVLKEESRRLCVIIHHHSIAASPAFAHSSTVWSPRGFNHKAPKPLFHNQKMPDWL